MKRSSIITLTSITQRESIVLERSIVTQTSIKEQENLLSINQVLCSSHYIIQRKYYFPISIIIQVSIMRTKRVLQRVQSMLARHTIRFVMKYGKSRNMFARVLKTITTIWRPGLSYRRYLTWEK